MLRVQFSFNHRNFSTIRLKPGSVFPTLFAKRRTTMKSKLIVLTRETPILSSVSQVVARSERFLEKRVNFHTKIVLNLLSFASSKRERSPGRCLISFAVGKRGRILSTQSILNLLTHPVYAGYNVYKGQLYKAIHPAIISVKQFNRVQRLILRQGKIHGQPRKTKLFILPED